MKNKQETTNTESHPIESTLSIKTLPTVYLLLMRNKMMT